MTGQRESGQNLLTLALLRRIRTPDAMSLPTNASYSPEDGGVLARTGAGFRIPLIFRRLHRFQQMARFAYLALSPGMYSS
jgi:hypothetical protein